MSISRAKGLNGQRSFVISGILLGYEQSRKARLAKKFHLVKNKNTQRISDNKTY